MTETIQSGASPPLTPFVVPDSRIDYAARGRTGFIGYIYQTSDGAWHAVSPWTEKTTHTGQMARWDASHALTLAYMRHGG